jgi:hypothetical protein
VRDAVVTSQTISEASRLGSGGGGGSPPQKRPRLLPALPPPVLPAAPQLQVCLVAELASRGCDQVSSPAESRRAMRQQPSDAHSCECVRY